MTNEEALYELLKNKPLKVFGTESYCKAYDIAIKALEKQIPQTTEIFAYDAFGENDIRMCPLCNIKLFRKSNCCPMCGQSLKW